jgi:hypothetical protein
LAADARGLSLYLLNVPHLPLTSRFIESSSSSSSHTLCPVTLPSKKYSNMSHYPNNQYGGDYGQNYNQQGQGYPPQQGQGYPSQQGYGAPPPQGYYPPEVSALHIFQNIKRCNASLDPRSQTDC